MSICLRLGLGLALGFRVSVECAFVVFALVVERVQDTVVRVTGFRRIHAQPLDRRIQEIRTSLTEQQRPRYWGEVACLHIMRCLCIV